ncbi:hypothetical protein BYI23_D013510 (plasmid) [Burkholderia sp. YI23]|nr:hypothetical protein BYI23_D013510 [Burkholderia sp. YI23]
MGANANLRALYGTLKHGGELGVEAHRARPERVCMIDPGHVTEASSTRKGPASHSLRPARSTQMRRIRKSIRTESVLRKVRLINSRSTYFYAAK